MKNRTISCLAVLLAIITVFSTVMISCSDNPDDGQDTKADTDNTQADTAKASNAEDEVPEMKFSGEEFAMIRMDQSHADFVHFFDEPSDDPVDYAKYRMKENLETRFDITINEILQTESFICTEYRNLIQSGSDDYDVAFLYDRFAHYYAEEGALYKYDDLVYIDLEKDYWDQSLLEYTTVGDNVYYAFGTCDFTYYDLTHCLIFNKQLIGELGLENPYDLVASNDWTLDKLSEMAKKATFDVNADGNMDTADSFGYLSAGKQILPTFWIAGGTTSVSLDEDKLPVVTILDNQRLLDIVDKCFSVFYGNEIWMVNDTSANQCDGQELLFESNRALFSDYTFYFLNQLRDCESDWGILPIPKYDKDQNSYFSRVEAGCTMAAVPITNADPDKASAIIEAMCSVGYKELLPAYYESALKRKVSRDEESQGMLDLIFKTRVYDLGDTWYCDQIRDGAFRTIWASGENGTAATFRAYDKKINKAINETREAFSK